MKPINTVRRDLLSSHLISSSCPLTVCWQFLSLLSTQESPTICLVSMTCHTISFPSVSFLSVLVPVGRVLAIPVSSLRPREPHRLLNYLTSPHVVIWSAVTASCAFPGLFEAQELMAKDRTGRMVPYHLPTEVRAEHGLHHVAVERRSVLQYGAVTASLGCLRHRS